MNVLHLNIYSWPPYSNELVWKILVRYPFADMSEGNRLDLERREGPEFLADGTRLEKEILLLVQLNQRHKLKTF